MVRLTVTHIDRLGDNSPEATIDAEITNVRELKAHLALHHPVPIPSDDQILLGLQCGTLLLDGDRLLNTIQKKPGEKLDIFMYRKLTNAYVTVLVEISPHFAQMVDLSLELTIPCDLMVSQLKDMIHEQKGIPPDNQVLTTYGVDMEPNLNLSEYILDMASQVILCRKFPLVPKEWNGKNLVTYTDGESSDTTANANEDGEDMDEHDEEDDGDMDEDNNGHNGI